MSKGILVLSGYNTRAVIAFCRWARPRRVPFHIIARNETDPIFLTAFRDSVFLTRKREDLELDDFRGWISRIREQCSYREVLVLPSTEFLNRFMLHHRAAIESAGGIVPLVAEELYERISDKYSFAQTCAESGVPVPEEYQAIPDCFPFVAKPKSYASILNRQLKPYLILNRTALTDFRRSETADNYFFQRYIEGKSLYLLASIPRTEAPVLFAQENLIQQANGGSVILARPDNFHEQKPALDYLALLAQLGFHGLIMIEVRLDRGTQRHFMIEANPRLWGPIQLIVDSGVDFFGAYLRDYRFDIGSSPHRRQCRPFYFWSGGLIGGTEPAYHNYSPNQFVREFNLISRHDLFLREDTLDLFRYEQRARDRTQRAAL